MCVYVCLCTATLGAGGVLDSAVGSSKQVSKYGVITPGRCVVRFTMCHSHTCARTHVCICVLVCIYEYVCVVVLLCSFIRSHRGKIPTSLSFEFLERDTVSNINTGSTLYIRHGLGLGSYVIHELSM